MVGDHDNGELSSMGDNFDCYETRKSLFGLFGQDLAKS